MNLYRTPPHPPSLIKFCEWGPWVWNHSQQRGTNCKLLRDDWGKGKIFSTTDTRSNQSTKSGIGKPIDKTLSIYKSMLIDIDQLLIILDIHNFFSKINQIFINFINFIDRRKTFHFGINTAFYPWYCISYEITMTFTTDGSKKLNKTEDIKGYFQFYCWQRLVISTECSSYRVWNRDYPSISLKDKTKVYIMITKCVILQMRKFLFTGIWN